MQFACIHAIYMHTNRYIYTCNLHAYIRIWQHTWALTWILCRMLSMQVWVSPPCRTLIGEAQIWATEAHQRTDGNWNSLHESANSCKFTVIPETNLMVAAFPWHPTYLPTTHIFTNWWSDWIERISMHFTLCNDVFVILHALSLAEPWALGLNQKHLWIFEGESLLGESSWRESR